MKIRVTFEVDDTDRVAVSVAQGMGFQPASRIVLENYIAEAVDEKLNGLRERFQFATDQIAGGMAVLITNEEVKESE